MTILSSPLLFLFFPLPSPFLLTDETMLGHHGNLLLVRFVISDDFSLPFGPLYYPLFKALLIFLYSVIFSFFFPSLLSSVSVPFSERVIVEDGATWEGGGDENGGWWYGSKA